MSFGWGTNVDIHKPPGGDGPIQDWKNLKFNPLGLYNLRRHLGALPQEPGIFTRYHHNFLASDIAWMAAGASQDGNHFVIPDVFHPLFSTSREHLPNRQVGSNHRMVLRKRLQTLAFDLATVWDRAFGGYTMIMHSEGATAPGTPALPEYLKAEVYLPPGLVNEFPQSHTHIRTIVQTFIEQLAVPTVQRFSRAASNKGWNFASQNESLVTALVPLAEQPDVPQPTPGTSHYTFHGRPQVPSIPNPALSNALVPPPPSFDVSAKLAEAEQSLGKLAEDLDQTKNALSETQVEVVCYSHQLATGIEREVMHVNEIADLKKEVQRLTNLVRTLAGDDTTPSKQGPAFPPINPKDLPRPVAQRPLRATTKNASTPQSTNTIHNVMSLNKTRAINRDDDEKSFHLTSIGSESGLSSSILAAPSIRVDASKASRSHKDHDFSLVDKMDFQCSIDSDMGSAVPAPSPSGDRLAQYVFPTTVPFRVQAPRSMPIQGPRSPIKSSIKLAKLGPATRLFVLNSDHPINEDTLILALQHIPLPQWSKVVASLKLGDEATEQLLQALTDDWKSDL